METIVLNGTTFDLVDSNAVRKVYQQAGTTGVDNQVAVFSAKLIKLPSNWIEADNEAKTEFGIADFKLGTTTIPASVWKGAVDAGMLTEEHVGTDMELRVPLGGDYANYYQVHFGQRSRPSALELLGIGVEQKVAAKV